MKKKSRTKYCVILITTPSKGEAVKIASGLVEARLAACVNSLDGISSLFHWKGQVDSARENLLIVKTKVVHLKRVIKKVRELHSYEVPEIIALPIIGGFPPYLEWIDESV